MELNIEEKRDLFYKALIEKGKKYGYTPHDVVKYIKCRINDDKTDLDCEPIPKDSDIEMGFYNDYGELFNTLFRGGALHDLTP